MAAANSGGEILCTNKDGGYMGSCQVVQMEAPRLILHCVTLDTGVLENGVDQKYAMQIGDGPVYSDPKG